MPGSSTPLLVIGKGFSTWIKGRIEKYGFGEGQDFVIVEDLSSPNPGSAKSRPQTLIEYHLTLDMGERGRHGREQRPGLRRPNRGAEER
jgi:anti-repressor protein